MRKEKEIGDKDSAMNKRAKKGPARPKGVDKNKGIPMTFGEAIRKISKAGNPTKLEDSES